MWIRHHHNTPTRNNPLPPEAQLPTIFKGGGDPEPGIIVTFYVIGIWQVTRCYKSCAVPAACLDVFSALLPPRRRFATPNSLFLLSKTGPSWTFFLHKSSQICTLTLWRTRESSAGTGNWDRTGGGTVVGKFVFHEAVHGCIYTVYKHCKEYVHFILFVRPKYQRNLSVVVRSLVRPGRCFERATAFLLVVRCWDDLRAFMPCHAMPVGTAK